MIRRAVAESANECPLAGALAGRLRDARHDLTLHWLERIVERVSIDRHRVFPSRDLLDHVPLLIDGIADYMEDPAAEVSVDMPVVGKAMELGALRHMQGFDAYEILKEYEILDGTSSTTSQTRPARCLSRARRVSCWSAGTGSSGRCRSFSRRRRCTS